METKLFQFKIVNNRKLGILNSLFKVALVGVGPAVRNTWNDLITYL